MSVEIEPTPSPASEKLARFRSEADNCVRSCVQTVLESPEISELLEPLGMEAELKARLDAEAPRLAEESAVYAEWRSVWLAPDAPVELAVGEKANSWIWVPTGCIGLPLFLLLVIGLGAMMIGYLMELIDDKLRSWPHFGWLSVVGALLLLIVICAPLGLLANRRDEGKNRAKLEAKQSTVTRDIESARLRFTADLTEQLNADVRTFLNTANRAASSDSRLRVRRWPGLNEAYEDVYWVQTPAAEELRAHLDQVGSGSIGLAGPRGSGKSTLMRLYCTTAAERAGAAGNLAFMVPAPVAYVASDFLVLMFSELCQAYLDLRKEPRTTVSARSPSLLVRALGGGRSAARQQPPRGRRALAHQAREYLVNLEYMITYSATLSVSAPVPMMQPSVSGGSSFERRAMSYPELVTNFRAFLTDVAQEVHARGCRVYIGIDEIDKIDSGPDAQRFVNELKVLFGIPHCFYLVSVSEDALTGFELRGLPIRDAFDSAFETKILSVGNLGIDHSRQLLEKRVVGMSEPYMWLCHCLSGGLPRDLIRACVQLIRIGQAYPPEQRLLSRLTSAVVAEELQLKATATMRSWAGRAPSGTDRELVYRLQGIGRTEVAAQDVRAVVEWAAEHIGAADETSVGLATAVLGGYAYFCLTLLEVFDAAIDPAAIVHPKPALENLARARRTFADDARLAWQLISDFRQVWGLEAITLRIPRPGPAPEV